MKLNEKTNKTDKLNEEQVLDYLQSNPEFFLKNELFLSRLVLDHNAGDATSLIERQMSSLRTQNQKIQNQITSMIKVAQDNDDIFEKIKSLSLSLFQSDSWQKLNETLATHFLTDFEADYILCNVVAKTDGPNLDHIKFEKISISENLIKTYQPVCTQLRAKEMKNLFGKTHNQNNHTESVILIPFGHKDEGGVLSIGSHDPNRFNSNMDTMFASYISSLLGSVIDRLCK